MTPDAPPGRIETLNGVRLYFDFQGTGEPLLLLHGFSGSSSDWKVSAVLCPASRMDNGARATPRRSPAGDNGRT